MDEPTTRALLAQMEVTSKLMRQLSAAGVLDPSWAAKVAGDAADRLEPIGDGLYLHSLRGVWKATAANLLAMAHPDPSEGD